jgi:hypothetical protein
MARWGRGLVRFSGGSSPKRTSRFRPASATTKRPLERLRWVDFGRSAFGRQSIEADTVAAPAHDSLPKPGMSACRLLSRAAICGWGRVASASGAPLGRTPLKEEDAIILETIGLPDKVARDPCGWTVPVF